MNGRYKLPDGSSVRTSAARRFLVVARYADARPQVVTTYDESVQAVRKASANRREYPWSSSFVVDTETGESWTV